MRIIPFNETTFAEALSNKHSHAEVIRSKKHFAYFLKYLSVNGINARTMVIEDKYISKDYLHDYASYYAFCFTDYEKFSRRIHFFSSEFDEAQLNTALLNTQEQDFWGNYLGFIVRKPLPYTVIGYTVLSVYPNEEGCERKFSGLREYKIHFFGKELSLRSLAFQEQDSVIAACATTAIWCMLNRASTDLHTTLKVPSEITKGAGLAQQGGRLFPNSGLEIRQICKAIISCGLEPELNQSPPIPGDHNPPLPTSRLRQLIYAYEGIGIPIILCIKVPHQEEYGFHAVAVSGYRMFPDDHIVQHAGMFVADRMEKFYVHDDQYGPFSWVKFIDDFGIESPWSTDDPEKRPTYVINAVVPVYPKIRITYENIVALVYSLDFIVKRSFELNLADDGAISWDIKLDLSENFKRYVLDSSLDNNVKLDIVKKSMPKYIWVVKCLVDKEKFFDCTFDATGVNHAMLGLEFISYSEADVNAQVHQYITEWGDGLAAIFENVGSGMKYIEHLLNKLNNWI